MKANATLAHFPAKNIKTTINGGSNKVEFFDLSVIISIVGVLVVITNIITQVLKQLTWDKLPTNILVVTIAMVLTLVALFAYCQFEGIAIVWYMVVAAVVLGFFVAYAAMFGFDKLKEAISQLDKK